MTWTFKIQVGRRPSMDFSKGTAAPLTTPTTPLQGFSNSTQVNIQISPTDSAKTHGISNTNEQQRVKKYWIKN